MSYPGLLFRTSRWLVTGHICLLIFITLCVLPTCRSREIQSVSIDPSIIDWNSNPLLIDDPEIIKHTEGCNQMVNGIKVTEIGYFNEQRFETEHTLAIKCIKNCTFEVKENQNESNSYYDEECYIAVILKIKEKVGDQKRNLVGATSAAQSIVSGTGISNFLISTTTSITVTAKDSTSNNVGFGNDVFFVEITNSCTKGFNFECVADPGRDTVLASDIIKQMYDNLDGTYTYSYTSSRPGKITLSVFLYTLGGVNNEFYTSSNWNGNNALTNTSATVQLSAISAYREFFKI